MSAHGDRSGFAHETTAAGRHKARLAWTLAITGGFLALEVVGGLWTGSLALLADAGHMLTDMGGLSLSFLAVWFAQKPPTTANTYGYFRTEILATLANAVVLFVVAGYILYEALHRVWEPPAILSVPMLVIAAIGLGVNLLGMGLLYRGAGESLNLRGAYLEVLSDALGSVGVILAALIIQTTGFFLADPIIGAAIGLFILPRTWGLMRQTMVHGVRAVHDLHVWTLTSGKDAMSSHVVVDKLAAGDRILRDLHRLLHERFGIEHTTIQLESEPLAQLVSAMDEPSPSGPEEKPRQS
jgi:cobalt-zinc-cadmium efflux system protein